MSRQEGRSSDAINNPVNRGGKELDTRDLDVRSVPSVSLDLSEERDREEIVLADDARISKEYAEELKFNEDILTIVLSRKAERYAALVEIPRVNGKGFGIEVGKKTPIPRKFVEVLARALPYDVRTTVTKHEDHEDNRVERQVIQQYPFTVLHDPSPKGEQWLRKIMMES